jgi:hypothetical protein
MWGVRFGRGCRRCLRRTCEVGLGGKDSLLLIYVMMYVFTTSPVSLGPG